MSNREKAQAASGKRTIKTVEDVPVFGTVRLRSLTEAEFQAGVSRWFRKEDFTLDAERQKYDRVKGIQMCMIEDDDSLSFSDSIDDLDILVGLGSPVIDALWDEVRDLTRAPVKN